MYAHLGLLEPGTAAIDRDGDVWCVWPSGHGGLHGPNISPDFLHTTGLYGPFDVLGVGLPSLVCDAVGRASQEGDPARAKALVLEHLGRPHPQHPLWAELGAESIDGPNGLRFLASKEDA